MLIENIKELLKYKDVLYALSSRELKSRYHQTFVGFFWAIIQPLVLMFILSIVFDKFFKIDNNGAPYPIFLYSTLVSWNFFSKTIGNATSVLLSNRLLVTKVYFPKEILTLSLIIANIFDFLAASLVLIFMMLYYNIPFSFYLLFLIPIFLIQFIFTLSISLFLSAANIVLRDIGSAINLIIQAWMYATPVIYSAKKIPLKYLDFYMLLNPLSPLIESYRTIIIEGKLYDLKYVIMSFITSTLLLFFSYEYFKKAEKSFADII